MADEQLEINRYADLLKKLHRLFDEGAGESEKADAIREEMLDLWKPMTLEEQDRARALSVRLKREARGDGALPSPSKKTLD